MRTILAAGMVVFAATRHEQRQSFRVAAARRGLTAINRTRNGNSKRRPPERSNAFEGLVGPALRCRRRSCGSPQDPLGGVCAGSRKFVRRHSCP